MGIGGRGGAFPLIAVGLYLLACCGDIRGCYLKLLYYIYLNLIHILLCDCDYISTLYVLGCL